MHNKNRNIYAIAHPRSHHSAIIVNSIENRRNTVIIGKLYTNNQHQQ